MKNMLASYFDAKKSKKNDKKGVEKPSLFEESMKKSLYVVRGLTGVALLVFVVMFIRYTSKISSYHENAEKRLSLPSSYTTKPLFEGKQIPEVSSENLFTMLSGYAAQETSIQKNKALLTSFRVPYQSLLRHIYLPSLNVWKNPFTNEIDTNLMGEAFLEKNPYTDIALINKRTNFFKSMGLDTYNEIESIKVENIVEEDDNFYIPVRVQFVAPSRRAFLFLLDKLALTSDKDNIMIINDFFYYLWESIENKHGDKLEEIVQKIMEKEGMSDIMITKDNRDMMMGYILMNRKEKTYEQNALLTDEIVQEAVRASALCDDTTSEEKCLFDFREKYRKIPRLAYGLGYNKAKASDMHYFLQGIPPLLVIDDFKFEKKYDDMSIGTDMKYNVSISLKVYGKGMKVDEVNEIGEKLGKKCFANDGQVMNIERALEIVEKKIIKDVDPAIVDRQRSKNLLEMKNILTIMQEKYQELTPYTKSIRLFEVYRMLDDMLLCE